MFRSSFRSRIPRLLAAVALGGACVGPWPGGKASDTADGDVLLDQVRQLTFAGRRSGEGYFSADGRQLVFQSEREPGNPFYQIYLMNLETGAVDRVSPGYGKTTCAWIHPRDGRVLFASTHHDAESEALQQTELEERASGRQRRYAWDYDPEFELYLSDPGSGVPARLTRARGYDAEAALSPDGDWIVFSSNRHAYATDLSEEEGERLEIDPAVFLDLYRMRIDGSGLERLTDLAGYDGGPFYSADGERIVWRHFSPDGATAEIFTMRADGSDVRQLTRLGAMSWAPFFHPTGEYVIFATNKHGFENFELYLVDAEGEGDPVRVTDLPGFDGLPVFSPDGRSLAWTRRREGADGSQIFLARWRHEAALRRLPGSVPAPTEPEPPAPPPPGGSTERLRAHVAALVAPDMDGRATGSAGEQRATQYVADAFAALGLEPAGDDGGYFQAFPFTAGVELGPANRLAVHSGGSVQPLALGEAWRPLALSRTGVSDPAPVVFAGYGLVAPAQGDHAGYDAYAGLDVRDKWVLALRFLPEDVSSERRQYLNRYAGVRYKAMLARENGARGLLLVTGPRSEVNEELLPLRADAALAGTSLFAITLTRQAARALIAPSGRTLAGLQAALDDGEGVPGFELPETELAAEVDLEFEKRQGRNVLGRLAAPVSVRNAPVIIGAHVDHLGRGSQSSLARGKEQGRVHPGADDNASGVAVLLEIARALAERRSELRRDVVFAAWSGEELGLLGSSHYARRLLPENPHAPAGDGTRPVAAYLNLDMVGRLREELVVHGTGSSDWWAPEIESANVPVALPLSVQAEAYLPTDTTAFYVQGTPVLSAFTGSHAEYHTPEDTADLLNFEGMRDVARLWAKIGSALAMAEGVPDYVAMERPAQGSSRGGIRVFLGTVPDYARTDVTGVALSGVIGGGPADRAGLRSGDVIVGLAGRQVENIYDYTYALEGLKVGEEVEMQVKRGGEGIVLRVTPESRR